MGIEKILFTAITTGNIETIEKYFESGLSDGLFYGLLFKTTYSPFHVNHEYNFDGNLDCPTIMHLAAKYGKANIIKYLLTHPKVDPNIVIKKKGTNENELTPLQIAIKSNNVDCIKILFSEVLSRKTTSSEKEEFLKNFFTRKPLTKEIVQMVDAESPLIINESIIHFAVRMASGKTLKVIKKLLRSVMKEILNKNELTNQFLDQHAVSRQDSNDNTPLHIAVLIENIDMIECLLLQDANVNARNKSGDTPLHIATRCENVAIMRFLLTNCAEKTAKNLAFETPLDIAEKDLNNDKVRQCLRQTGSFELPAIENDIINYASRRAHAKFNEGLKTGLHHALLQAYHVLHKYASKERLTIAVIGDAGSGKSALINAIYGSNVAPSGPEIDKTRYPKKYILGEIIVVDFPGFGTIDYNYKEFEKHFCSAAYDLVIIPFYSKASGNCATCVANIIKTNKNAKCIFVRTHLDEIKRQTPEKLELEKTRIIADFTKQIQGALDLEFRSEYQKNKSTIKQAESKYINAEIEKHLTYLNVSENMFFVSVGEANKTCKATVENYLSEANFTGTGQLSKQLSAEEAEKDKEVYEGISILKECIRGHLSSKLTQQIKQHEIEKIFAELKVNFNKKHAECQSVADKQWWWALASLSAKVVVPGVLAFATPISIVGIAAGLMTTIGFDTLFKKERDTNKKIDSILGLNKEDAPESKNVPVMSVMRNIFCEGEGICAIASKFKKLVEFCTKNPSKCVSTARYSIAGTVEKIGFGLNFIWAAFEEYKILSNAYTNNHSAQDLTDKLFLLQKLICDGVRDLRSIYDSIDVNGNTFLMNLLKYYSGNTEYMNCVATSIECTEPLSLTTRNKENSETLFMYAVRNRRVLYSLIHTNILSGPYHDLQRYFDDLQLADNEGRTVFMHAALIGNANSLYFVFCCIDLIKNITKEILEHEISADEINNRIVNIIKMKDRQGRNALIHSIIKHENVALLLLGQAIDVQSENGKFVASPVKNSLLMEEINANVDISEINARISNTKDERKKQLLQNGIKKIKEANAISIDLVTGRYFNDEVILEYINEADGSGKTALIYAITETDNVDLVKVLLKKGANINQADNNGKTPIIYALGKGDKGKEFVKILLESSKDLNVKTNLAWPILHIAVAKGLTETVTLLLNSEKNPTAKVKVGMDKLNVLHIAAQNNDFNMISILLTINKTARKVLCKKRSGVNNDTALHMAVEHGDPKIITALVNALIEDGTGCERRNINGKTAIEVAQDQGKGKIAQLIGDLVGGWKDTNKHAKPVQKKLQEAELAGIQIITEKEPVEIVSDAELVANTNQSLLFSKNKTTTTSSVSQSRDILTTAGDGDCAFHAVFGELEGSQYSCNNVAERRHMLADKIIECKPDSLLFELVVTGVPIHTGM